MRKLTLLRQLLKKPSMFMRFCRLYPVFDREIYLEEYDDVRKAGINPLFHYVKYGCIEGRICPLKKKVLNKENRIKLPNKLLQKFVDNQFYLSSCKLTEQSNYVDKMQENLADLSLNIKTIAFYLPQFHPFKENNEWWGDGFTEWTNVSKASPQYLGHRQPHLPGEMGFYDLRLTSEVMSKQIALAKKYGLRGFCFHHYWFGGKRLMEVPVNNFLKDKSLDFEFCLCWANENWTRKWDGAENDILIKQEHSPEDDVLFLEDILPALKDNRYITINSKPLLIVYRASLLPNAKDTAERWREHAKKNGLPGLYIVAAKSFDIVEPTKFGFDACVEFPPHQVSVKNIKPDVDLINKEFRGTIYSYEELASIYCERNTEDFVNFKTAVPSWDNEARKPGRGQNFHNAKPEYFERWFDKIVNITMKIQDEEKRLVFINAWNEWAEGAHLEPDRYYGYAYLDKVAKVLKKYSK